eukprot:m.585334 g.585334  ORF g.585334 m.585334 type:complete len:323 (-) comp22339_c1_seq102:3442-4410(-)
MAARDAPLVKADGSITVVTYNVHHFRDASGCDNAWGVLNTLASHRPDVVCLQEFSKRTTVRRSDHSSKPAKRKGKKGRSSPVEGATIAPSSFNSKGQPSKWKFKSISEFLSEGLAISHPGCDTFHVEHVGGCAIFSRFPITLIPAHGETEAESYGQRRFGRVLRVSVDVSMVSPTKTLQVVCLHLDHFSEVIRMAQIKAWVEAHFSDDCAQIWTGDFNALTTSDYAAAELEEVARVRAQNQWESPQNDVSTLMKQHGFADAWAEHGMREGGLSTCRFNTRIDYVYVALCIATPPLCTFLRSFLGHWDGIQCNLLYFVGHLNC